MYFSETTSKEHGLFRMTCPNCGQEANFQLSKKDSSGCLFLIPLWGTEYYATCGNCFTTFKIDKDIGKGLEEASPTAKQEKAIEEERRKELDKVRRRFGNRL
jgi:hypothetical protein